jgi:hypothetical protein
MSDTDRVKVLHCQHHAREDFACSVLGERAFLGEPRMHVAPRECLRDHSERRRVADHFDQPDDVWVPDAPEYFHLGLYSLEDVVIVELLGVKDLDGHFARVKVNHGRMSPTWAARGGFATSREVHLGGCALADLLEKLVPRLDVVHVMVGEVCDAHGEHLDKDPDADT